LQNIKIIKKKSVNSLFEFTGNRKKVSFKSEKCRNAMQSPKYIVILKMYN